MAANCNLNMERDLEMNHDGDTTSDSTKMTGDTYRDKPSVRLAMTEAVRDFSPVFFVNVMATGISGSILYNFPYGAQWLKVLGVIFWGVGIFFFLTGVTLMTVSCLKYKGNALKFMVDAKYSPFMGCFAMGFNSLVNMLYYITGDSWIVGIFVLWWISVVFCVLTAFIVFYFTFLVKTQEKQYYDPKNIHPVVLLPVVALTVTSSAGQIFALDLPGTMMPLVVVLVSYVLWAIAISFSFILVTMIFYKFMVYKIPPTGMVFTTFIPIGFLGQGAFSILKGGHNLYELTKHHPNLVQQDLQPFIPSCLLIVCSLAGLFLISFGYFNTFVAVTSVLTKICTQHPNPQHICSHNSGWKRTFNGWLKYNKGFWAMTFPCGTMAISNSQLGEMFNIDTFKVIGAIYGAFTVIATFGCCMGLVYHSFEHLRR